MNYYTETYNLMQEIWSNFTEDEKGKFLCTHPAMMHSTLGQHLRNYANLWDITWTPVLENGVDVSPNHPDAISQRVIEDFQTAKLSEN